MYLGKFARMHATVLNHGAHGLKGAISRRECTPWTIELNHKNVNTLSGFCPGVRTWKLGVWAHDGAIVDYLREPCSL